MRSVEQPRGARTSRSWPVTPTVNTCASDWPLTIAMVKPLELSVTGCWASTSTLSTCPGRAPMSGNTSRMPVKPPPPRNRLLTALKFNRPSSFPMSDSGNVTW